AMAAAPAQAGLRRQASAAQFGLEDRQSRCGREIEPAISAPPFVARAEHELETMADRPAILAPERQGPRPAARSLGQRAGLAVPPVVRGVAVAGQVEPVGMQAEAQLV